MKVFNWTATLYKGAISFETPMLFAVGFVSPRNEPCQITYELNAGQPFVKATASAGVEKLRVQEEEE